RPQRPPYLRLLPRGDLRVRTRGAHHAGRGRLRPRRGVQPAGGRLHRGVWADVAGGSLGLLVNVISVVLLRSGSTESLAVRGAYLEVLADALGSVGVIVAAVLMQLTGSPLWDLVVAV